MTINKAVSGVVSVVALLALTAGATQAAIPAKFGFTSVFTPIILSNQPGTYITVQDGSALGNFAPTQVSLTNFSEVALTNNFATINQPITLDLTLTPDGGVAQTKQFTGIYSGTLNQGVSNTTLVFNNPTSLTYDFGSLGSYTVNHLRFVAPGIGSSPPGSLGADVTFAAVPEASSVVSLGLLLALGLGGMTFAARKKKAFFSR